MGRPCDGMTLPVDGGCHPGRNEGSGVMGYEILRCAQDDRFPYQDDGYAVAYQDDRYAVL